MTLPGPRYFFVHLQKTAGTALFRRLRHHFGTAAVYPRPDEQGTAAAVLDVAALRTLLARDTSIDVVTGHFPLCVTDLLPAPVSTFTILRDPVERTLSFLRHQREVEPRMARWSLEEVYSDPVSTGGLVTNHMVKMLAMTAEEMTEGALTPLPADEAHLERARHRLEHDIDVMGLQEHFDTFCTDLEAAFGWDLGPPLFMNRTSPAPASPSLQDQIRRDNEADLRLYDFATRLWEHRHPGTPATGPAR